MPRTVAGHLLLLALTTLPVAAEPPRVVVTIAPVHSLVAGVTAGVTRPLLLLEGGASPHAHAMRPSQMRAVQQADLLVWVGESLETFLARTLATTAEGRRVLEVLAIPEVAERASREHGHAAPAARDHGRLDPHVWLDPRDALAIVRAVTAALVELDPANAARYRGNARASRARIEALDAELERLLEPVRDRPFVVFHDAYGSFERRYGLHAAGAVTISPERKAGAARLVELRETIVRLGARCVFSEPQFEPRLVHTVTAGTGARAGVLDPLGADLEPGPDAWFTMMRRLALALVDCLADG